MKFRKVWIELDDLAKTRSTLDCLISTRIFHLCGLCTRHARRWPRKTEKKTSQKNEPTQLFIRAIRGENQFTSERVRDTKVYPSLALALSQHFQVNIESKKNGREKLVGKMFMMMFTWLASRLTGSSSTKFNKLCDDEECVWNAFSKLFPSGVRCNARFFLVSGAETDGNFAARHFPSLMLTVPRRSGERTVKPSSWRSGPGVVHDDISHHVYCFKFAFFFFIVRSPREFQFCCSFRFWRPLKSYEK